MTPEKQNVAIARACGWKESAEVDRFGNRYFEKDGQFRRAGDYPKLLQPLPSYTSDLNAIRAAALSKFSTPTERFDFVRHLQRIASCTRPDSADNTRDSMEVWAVFAEAEQWSEAFLRTLNLWEDE